MTDLSPRRWPQRQGVWLSALFFPFCLVTHNLTSTFVHCCSFPWMFSIITSASDSMPTSRWSSMNPEVRTAPHFRLLGREFPAGVLRVPFCLRYHLRVDSTVQFCFIGTSMMTLGARQYRSLWRMGPWVLIVRVSKTVRTGPDVYSGSQDCSSLNLTGNFEVSKLLRVIKFLSWGNLELLKPLIIMA